MEREAKAVDGKNALGIALLKHSGNISQTIFKWKYEVENADNIDMITVSQNLVEIIKKGEVSKKFMYTFREVFTRLTNRDGVLELPHLVETGTWTPNPTGDERNCSFRYGNSTEDL